jgi:hypothetical protein
MPAFEGKPKKAGKPKKEPTKVLVEKEVLAKTNRTVICKYCESPRILNPDQYQTLFDQYESEEKLNEEFMCKPCDMDMKRNPIKFWTLFGEPLQILSKNLKAAFEAYRMSARTDADVVSMQTTCIAMLKECKIVEPNFEFIIHERFPVALAIKNIPYVGTVILRVYEQQRKNRIHIHE